MTPTVDRLPHYASPVAQRADFLIHLVGLILACVGGVVMLRLAAGLGAATMWAIGIYALGFVLMLSFSFAYNFSSDGRRDFCRRLDHSGIFLMIAGTYTPFTTLALTGIWAWGMTAYIWSVALAGILAKLFAPELRESLWVAMYLALGWTMVVALRPLAEALPTSAFALLLGGGVLYSLGVPFHVMEHLRFSRPIWHVHVLAGAGAHWAAILLGTVLRP